MGRAASAVSLLQSSTRLLAGPLGGLVLVLAATLLRTWLGRFVPGVSPFGLFYPAVLVAALIGGWSAAGAALVLSLLVSWSLFIPHLRPLEEPAALTVNLLIFLFTASLLALVGARLRALLARHRATNAKLADRELRYRTLFEGISEGFALVEAVRDASGRLADLRLLDANPALLRLLKSEGPMLGRTWREISGAGAEAYLAANARALAGEPIVTQMESAGGRWFEIRINRVGPNRLAQIVVDITERKAAERRQTELFDELNHRVKNNLAMVSAMLSMQARVTPQPEVREQLQAAVARIQTIADVHASLYRSSRKDDVDFSAYLQDLCERLGSALVDPARVRIEVAAEPAAMPLDRAVALGLIVNELVTNAAKHAFPQDEAGVIRVELSNRAGDLSLAVVDSGRGMVGAEPGPGAGLGMRLVRSLVQQVGGRLELDPTDGTAFRIHLRAAKSATGEAQNRLL